MKIRSAGEASRKRVVVASLSAVLMLGTTLVAATASHAATVTHVKLWSWYPNQADVVKVFNATHKDIQIDWTNAGAGGAEYTKLKACIKAGSGCPDVAMIEFQELPTFAILKPFVDMGKYGANNTGGKYAGWAWGQSTSGTKVNAIPIDGGPMGLMYRKDLFTQANLPVPTTWAQYETDAAAIHAADPTQYIATFGNDSGWAHGLMWQGGCVPYKYNAAASLTKVSIHLNTAACKNVINFWGGLVDKGLVDTKPFFSTDAGTDFDSGKYWTWEAAGWSPGYMAGLIKTSLGNWALAPSPQYTAGTDIQSDWGGSTFTVINQTKVPAAASFVAINTYPAKDTLASGTAWDIGLNKAFLYPLPSNISGNKKWLTQTYPIFGTQQTNQILLHASKTADLNYQWTPFQDFIFQTMHDEFALALSKKEAWSATLDNIQAKSVAYAKAQGFSVS